MASQPCLICGKGFENSYKAIKHLLTHVPEKAFGCSRCHETFSTAGKILMMILMIVVLMPFTVKTSLSNSTIAEERNVHTSSHVDSDKQLECPKCPNSFTSLLLLNKHEVKF